MVEFTINTHGTGLCCKLLIYPHGQKTPPFPDPKKRVFRQLLAARLDTEGVRALST